MGKQELDEHLYRGKLAHQRRREMLRAAEQRRPANLVIARLPAPRFALRARLGDVLNRIEQELKALANAG